jgi:imidazole glycerol phosphate synthase subunit hisf
MDYSLILKNIENIKKRLVNLEDCKIKSEYEKMSVSEFNSILNSVKKYEVLEKDESPYFVSVFGGEDYYENISDYVDQVIRRISLKTEQSGVSLEVSKNLQVCDKDIKDVIDLLSVEYANLLKADSKKWIRKYDDKRKEVSVLLTELTDMQKRLEVILKAYAVVIANVVLSEFKTLYKFFLYCIKTAKARQDELLLIEIAGMTDRIISMISPVFSDKSLKTDEMVYHYLAYELKELKIDSIGEKLS